MRERTGRFLVEGPQAVREAVRHAEVLELWVDDAGATRHPELLEAAGERGIRVRTAAPAVIAAVSDDAQGVLAVAGIPDPSLGSVLAAAPRLVALLSHVRDPGNAGTVVRAADAAGADAVVLSEESVDPYGPKVVRSTVGSLFHLPVVTGLAVTDAVGALRAAGVQVLAADARGDHDLDALQDGLPLPVGPGGSAAPDLAAPTAWLFGNEAWGLSPEEVALADASVRVPIHGRAESLNLATAAALCLYGTARVQRRAQPRG